jgi:hypothetical protein
VLSTDGFYHRFGFEDVVYFDADLRDSLERVSERQGMNTGDRVA